jgi:uncharacterized protein (DUF1800 family)
MKKHLATTLLVSLMLTSCGDSSKQAQAPSFVASEGQVLVSDPVPKNANFYAASRFLEQASWGPNTASVADVQRSGQTAWIDRQLALPASILRAPNYVIDFSDENQAARDLAHGWIQLRFMDLAMGGEDQLRQRMTWALFNFIVANGNPYGRVEYMNTLQKNALGSFSDLIKGISLSPIMGTFLNNDQNEANRPNENYARELMQLFTVGLVLLNQDGTLQRDASGKPLETYTQQDVIEATKALSGWQPAWEANLPQQNWGNFGVPMRPKSWSGAHSAEQKKVLGKIIPAGQGIEKDLDSLIAILVNHPNTAPFVARRLIQSLVTSNPSPEYMTRVSKVFVSSGGNLGQVAKAILLDPEARTGDSPLNQKPIVGKIKEPLLHHINLLRGMNCTAAVRDRNNVNSPFLNGEQRVLDAPSVFGYFPPDHKAPESLTPAPEQKLLNSRAFRDRAGGLSWHLEITSNFTNAGCDIDAFIKASERSPEELVQLISTRYFKGAMPAPLREGALNLLGSALLNEPHLRKVAMLIETMSTTPTFGVIK